MRKKPQSRRYLTQPPDWWDAFEAAAQAAGMSLSEWLGEAGKKLLPKEVKNQLSERTRGRPKNEG